jgi:hypothetical protein
VLARVVGLNVIGIGMVRIGVIMQAEKGMKTMVMMEGITTVISIMHTKVKAVMPMPSPGIRVAHLSEEQTHCKQACSEHPAVVPWPCHNTPFLYVAHTEYLEGNVIVSGTFSAVWLVIQDTWHEAFRQASPIDTRSPAALHV